MFAIDKDDDKTNIDTIVSILFYFVVVTDFNPYRVKELLRRQLL
jgi:hypothetical protein